MQNQPKITVFDTTTFSPEKPLSPMGSIFTYYPSANPEALHYHDFFEIGYCEKGAGIFNVSGEPIPFNGRCTTLVYGGQPHIALSTNREKSRWHFLYIDLNNLFAKGDINPSFLQKLKSAHWEEYETPNLIAYEDRPDIYELCRQIIQLGGESPRPQLDPIRGLTYTLLKRHEQMFKPKKRETGQSSSLQLQRELEDTINYIAEHFAEHITIDELTKCAMMSKSNLQRKMIEFTGRAPMQYVQYVRMRHASVMLLDRTKSIASIAYDTGYTTSCFNRQFLKEFGVSPSKWRSLHNVGVKAL